MTAKTSRPKRADSKPFELPFDFGKGVSKPMGNGVTASEVQKRNERYLYLKRKGRSFDNPVA